MEHPVKERVDQQATVYSGQETLMHSRLSRQTLAWYSGIALIFACSGATSVLAATDREPLTPKAVATAVERELSADAIVALDDARASVSDGVARLEGSVSSLLAKDRATLIAETVKGVRSVDNALVVEPKRDLDPDELERRVRHAIFAEPSAELFEVNVTAIPPGIVVIAGAVDTRIEKEMIERAVRAVSGVTAVRNRLRVDYQATRAEAEIERDIDALLRWDVYVDAGKVDVDVRNGVATLSGVVASAAEKRRVRDLALSADVRDVNVDALEVARWARDSDLKDAYDVASDDEVQQAVKRALQRTAAASAELSIDADKGVVTLRGRVPSLRMKLEATKAARSIAAVHTVRNQLRVDARSVGTATLTDADIERRIERALLVNPLTESFEIDVTVRRGIATLKGRVGSWYARGEAGDLAAGVRGVNEVDNDLEVTNTREAIVFDPYVDNRSLYLHEPPEAMSRLRDAAIEAQIRDQLWWSPFVEESEIEVSVDGGVVTLSGTVNGPAERAAAHENAIEGGGTRVIDQLRLAKP